MNQHRADEAAAADPTAAEAIAKVNVMPLDPKTRESGMTEAEARTIIDIAQYADGECPDCVAGLIDGFNDAFPAHDWWALAREIMGDAKATRVEAQRPR